MNIQYTYTPDQVHVYSEEQSTLTTLERTLLDRVDELTLTLEEL